MRLAPQTATVPHSTRTDKVMTNKCKVRSRTLRFSVAQRLTGLLAIALYGLGCSSSGDTSNATAPDGVDENVPNLYAGDAASRPLPKYDAAPPSPADAAGWTDAKAVGADAGITDGAIPDAAPGDASKAPGHGGNCACGFVSPRVCVPLVRYCEYHPTDTPCAKLGEVCPCAPCEKDAACDR